MLIRILLAITYYKTKCHCYFSTFSYSLVFFVERTGVLIDSRVELGVDLTALIDLLATVTFPSGYSEYTILTGLVLPLTRTSYTQLIPVVGSVNVAHYTSWQLAIYQAYMASLTITLEGGMFTFFLFPYVCTCNIFKIVF